MLTDKEIAQVCALIGNGLFFSVILEGFLMDGSFEIMALRIFTTGSSLVGLMLLIGGLVVIYNREKEEAERK